MDYQPFYTLLNQLKEEKKKFDSKTLKRLKYDELNLAAMGNAGECRCSIDEVIQEKSKRRTKYVASKFLNRDVLEDLGMLDDILADRIKISNTPTWDSLSVVAKLWFKLSCLEMHTDYPGPRIEEVILLFQECLKQEKPPMPWQIAKNFQTEFQSIYLRLNKLPDEVIRDCCTQCANVLYGFITGDEIEICDAMSLKDYSCSSGCFFPIGV